VGYASPGFGTVEQMSAPETIAHINQSGADFVVLALGACKGQAWIERNHQSLNAPVISHLGAVVNFMAGTVVRAPAWMQYAGLEWLWRIKEEPALWRRYWGDARLLARLIGSRVLPALLYRGAARFRGTSAPATAGVFFNGADEEISGQCPVATLVLSGAWSDADMPLLRKTLERLSREPAHINVDVSALRRVNGAFIALLMLLHAQQRKAGHGLSFLSPTKELRRHLKLHCADFLLAPIEAQV
jgi:N-acetylglucosaminyldiphosphoundecaprenol N-acetyl-beta-D-mannosaminyltransferase